MWLPISGARWATDCDSGEGRPGVPVDLLLDDAAGALEKLATLPVMKGALNDLGALCSRIKQAEKAFPSIPISTVVATIEASEKTVMPDDFVKRLARKAASDKILDLCRQQGGRRNHGRTDRDRHRRTIIKPLLKQGSEPQRSGRRAPRARRPEHRRSAQVTP